MALGAGGYGMSVLFVQLFLAGPCSVRAVFWPEG
jgi:hypothetical protein